MKLISDYYSRLPCPHGHQAPGSPRIPRTFPKKTRIPLTIAGVTLGYLNNIYITNNLLIALNVPPLPFKEKMMNPPKPTILSKN